jgi:hypothetical protein
MDTPQIKQMCGRCYDEVDTIYPANCQEKPEDLIGQPLGQYHCPDCGAMVVAGIPHPDLCKACLDRVHPGFDFSIGEILLSGSIRSRLINAMTWMTDDMKHRFAADNPDTDGDYSPELKEAMELLRILKEGRA